MANSLYNPDEMNDERKGISQGIRDAPAGLFREKYAFDIHR
ncbi:MAG TPA: hypothetical protein PKA21_06255 [Kiritimatiellia bacterium]|nr:hypothetical protein [Kiritimatiellia bacterium]